MRAVLLALFSALVMVHPSTGKLHILMLGQTKAEKRNLYLRKEKVCKVPAGALVDCEARSR